MSWIMTPIGETFGLELRRAGIENARCAWTREGVRFLEDCPPAQRAAIEAVIAAHNPGTVVSAVDEVDERLSRDPMLQRLVAAVAQVAGVSQQRMVEEMKAVDVRSSGRR